MYHSGNKLIDPSLLFEKTQLQPGMHVAVFGTGRTGHMVFPAAMSVGPKGVVYAVDILKELLAVVAKRAALEGLGNITTVWGDVERVGTTAIPGKTLDIVFLVNVLVRIHDRHAALEEAARLLKEKGRILVVDWSKDGVPIAPNPEKFVDFTDIEAWANSRSFVVEQEFSAGRYHKGTVLYRHV